MNTLQLDIEFYATILTVKNPDYKPDDGISQDIYLLDTSKFEEKHFNALLPYAGASIIRNTPITIESYTINEINPSSYFEYVSKQEQKKTKVFFPNTTMSSIHIFDDKQIKSLNEGKTFVDDYKTIFEKNYNQAREKYYKLVDNAEEKIKPIKDKFEQTYREYKTKPGTGKDEWQKKLKEILNPDEIVEATKAIGLMNIYREESYVCSSTIMHVVRVLQANKNKDTSKFKYPVSYPACLMSEHQLEAPVCELGKYGYLLSMLEQVGYILRFQKYYCVEHNNEEKCSSKILKYMERYTDAIDKIKIIDSNTNQLQSQPLLSKGGRKQIARKRITRKKVKVNRRIRKTKKT
jgi:hypothetical protein